MGNVYYKIKIFLLEEIEKFLLIMMRITCRLMILWGSSLHVLWYVLLSYPYRKYNNHYRNHNSHSIKNENTYVRYSESNENSGRFLSNFLTLQEHNVASWTEGQNEVNSFRFLIRNS